MGHPIEVGESLDDSCGDYAWLPTNGAPYRAVWERYLQDHDLHGLIAAVGHSYAADPVYARLVERYRQPGERGAGHFRGAARRWYLRRLNLHALLGAQRADVGSIGEI